MPAKSSLRTSTALSIFSSASNIVSSIMVLRFLVLGGASGCCHVVQVLPGAASAGGRGRWSGVGHQRADPLTEQRSGDVSRAFHPEDDHRQLVLHAEAEGGGVDDLEALHDRVVEGDRLE